MLPVTAPLMHHSGKRQVTGEALYIDDIKNPSGGLYSSFVLSTRAHARIVAINPEKVLLRFPLHSV
jgi:xanthine dehydrogenase molybdopterin-binding subunit B